MVNQHQIFIYIFKYIYSQSNILDSFRKGTKENRGKGSKLSVKAQPILLLLVNRIICLEIYVILYDWPKKRHLH